MSLILLFKFGREKILSLLAEEENIVSELHTEFIKNEQAGENAAFFTSIFVFILFIFIFC